MKTQIQTEVETLKWQILPSGRRDHFSCANATRDAQIAAKEWYDIRAGDREAALLLATEILVDAELFRTAHILLMHYFQDDAERILNANPQH